MSSPRRPAPLAAIVGPTASGKSDLALALARQLPVEILVADSRQVYRGMDIGTAKPDAAARRAVPHHLLDLVAPSQPFSVADWVRRAREVLPQIAGRGRLPLVVAGTGLYLSALVDGFEFDERRSSPEERQRLLSELDRDGLAVLAARLKALAPAAASRIDLRNPRRVVRAIERLELTGTPLAVSATPYPGRVAIIGISRPRQVLVARVDARARDLIGSGLIDEARRLLEAGASPDSIALTGHGYREALAVLDGRMTAEEAVGETARRTRQYARRQMTWWRRDRRIVWLAAGERAGDDPLLVAQADRVLRSLLS